MYSKAILLSVFAALAEARSVTNPLLREPQLIFVDLGKSKSPFQLSKLSPAEEDQVLLLL
jgi:hypothetical protein